MVPASVGLRLHQERIGQRLPGPRWLLCIKIPSTQPSCLYHLHVLEPEISEVAATWDKEWSRPYLTLLTISSKLENYIQHNNKKEPEPLADEPAWGVLWQVLPNPEVPSAGHLPGGFFDVLPQRRKHKGVAARQAHGQEQGPSQGPHGEQRWGRRLLMVGLSALAPGL